MNRTELFGLAEAENRSLHFSSSFAVNLCAQSVASSIILKWLRIARLNPLRVAGRSRFSDILRHDLRELQLKETQSHIPPRLARAARECLLRNPINIERKSSFCLSLKLYIDFTFVTRRRRFSSFNRRSLRNNSSYETRWINHRVFHRSSIQRWRFIETLNCDESYGS